MTGATRQKLETALREVFGQVPGDLTPGLALGRLKGWDSMNAVTFSMELERVFEVDLDGAVLTADQTIGDALQLVRNHGGQP